MKVLQLVYFVTLESAAVEVYKLTHECAKTRIYGTSWT